MVSKWEKTYKELFLRKNMAKRKLLNLQKIKRRKNERNEDIVWTLRKLRVIRVMQGELFFMMNQLQIQLL
jgi:hypothetical protein